jgi:hypothetical protein
VFNAVRTLFNSKCYDLSKQQFSFATFFKHLPVDFASFWFLKKWVMEIFIIYPDFSAIIKDYVEFVKTTVILAPSLASSYLFD